MPPEAFDGPVVPKRLAACLASPGPLMILARDGGGVAGQGAAIIHRHPDRPDELSSDNLGVMPELQRLGIGRRLMEAILAAGRQRGCAGAWVATETDNAPAARARSGAGAGGGRDGRLLSPCPLALMAALPCLAAPASQMEGRRDDPACLRTMQGRPCQDGASSWRGVCFCWPVCSRSVGPSA
ncbi:MAG: GNAT family N-acetyltransferase [Phreatobacter sp.]